MESALVLKLSDYQKEELKRQITLQLETAKKQVRELENLLEQFNDTTQTSAQTDFSTVHASDKQHEVVEVFRQSPTTTEYKTNWSWAMKAKFILSKANRCLTTREITDKLHMYEDNLQNPIKAISSSISAKINQNKMFARYLVEEEDDSNLNSGTYYNGLVEWFDKNGNLINEKYRGKE